MSDYLNRPVIFLGFGRCGSTIISEIIFQHHKLAWVSNYQQKFPSSTKINLLRNLFDNPLWRYNGQKDQLNEVPLFNKYIFKPAESYRFWGNKAPREFHSRPNKHQTLQGSCTPAVNILHKYTNG